MSADGSVVVGFSRSANDNAEAVYWTRTSGLHGMGFIGGGSPNTAAYGVSSTGAVIVGEAAFSGVAFRWQAGVMTNIGDLPGGAVIAKSQDVSADGSVVVGYSRSSFGAGLDQNDAFIWTASQGMRGIGQMSGTLNPTYAYGISSDGKLVVGDSGQVAYRWSQSLGMDSLGDLPGGEFRSSAIACSSDGSVVVGKGSTVENTTNIQMACRWINGGDPEPLGYLPGSTHYSYAYGVSGDGSIIVGDSNFEAMIWTEQSGIRQLADLLNDLGVSTAGWQLQHASAISADGSTIVGYGIGPGGVQGFVATLPEPTSVVWISAVSSALLMRRRLR